MEENSINIQHEIIEITADTLKSSRVLQLVWNVFEEFEAYQCSAKGVREFQNFIEGSSIEKLLGNSEMIMWGSFYNGEIIGAIAAKSPNHISLLFVDKKYHRRGIARALYQKFIEYSKKDNCSEISVNSSLYAVEAYKRLGFVATDTEQEHENGIRFVPMKHKLHCQEMI
ncbi:MAG: GNAT family N-acetyltransferase [Bacteroidales bacterium]|jgi:GNAT superfamily N-acetyltransferase|nr:GNAT family N-acetyltransferase [Bacteroidales bacterium]